MRTPLTRLYLAPLLLAATLPGAAQAQARGQAAPAQIQSRLQSLVTVGDADIWLAFDAPNQKYLFVGGSDSLRIISKNGVVLATIDRVDNVGVSRRSDRVVFTRIIDPKPPAGDGAWTDTYVWTVGIDTATGRLTEAPRRVSINPGLNPSISPDGKEISFIRYGAGGYRIVTIPVRGGEERVVVARPGRIFTHGWSNDGKWIYYSHTPQGARPRIERVIAGGGQPDSLVAAFGAFLGFSRDGQYFAVGGGNSTNLINVFRPTGERVGVVTHTGRASWSAATSNRLILTENHERSVLRSITLPEGTTRDLPSATEYDARALFTPDSKHIVFQGQVNGRYQFFISDPDGKGRRALPTRAEPTEGARGPLASPNSRFLVFRSDTSRVLNLLDLESGAERTILRQHFGALAWRVDGAGLLFVDGPPTRRVIHQVGLDGKISLVRDIGSFAEGAWLHFVNDTLVMAAGRKGVHAISLRSGTTYTLYGGPAVNAGQLPVSPDGKWIAFANIDTVRPNEELLMMSLDGKQSRVLAQNPYCGIYALGWHPNGRDVFLTKSLRCDNIDDDRIYMASLNGNPLRDLAPNEPLGAIGSMAARADGKQLVYSAIRERRGRVIALDLTLPRR